MPDLTVLLGALLLLCSIYLIYVQMHQKKAAPGRTTARRWPRPRPRPRGTYGGGIEDDFL